MGREGATSADGPGWGGGLVVVRGRESRPHGEAAQRIRVVEELQGTETLVNTGDLWPDPDGARLRVRRMQTKLHQWAVDDPDRRFDDGASPKAG